MFLAQETRFRKGDAMPSPHRHPQPAHEPAGKGQEVARLIALWVPAPRGAGGSPGSLLELPWEGSRLTAGGRRPYRQPDDLSRTERSRSQTCLNLHGRADARGSEKQLGCP